ncbi:MAG: hypothetical protein U0R51_00790 [Solirubrobacterales bacterium]
MNFRLSGAAITIAAVVILLTAGSAPGHAAKPRFGGDSARITNPYLPISKFHRCVLRGRDGHQQLRIVRTVRPRTKTIEIGRMRVRAAVVRDTVRNLRQDRRIERTIDYFAQDRRGGVHYLGEDVDEYLPNGGISHEGQWRAGRRGAPAGLLMPAHPRAGRSFRSERAPGVAVEQDTIVWTGRRQTVRGHGYDNVMKIREHATVPKPAEFETKTYARGVGVITEADGGVGLVGCS